MQTGNQQKGRALERAVRFIQETILKSDPKLTGIKFSIESNKIISVSGVRHEIDVLVKTAPGSPFESTWVFECKNWEKPVGKNEVIILAEKVGALCANRGFLVAKTISRDAEAQIKRDGRLNFVEYTDDFLTPFSFNLFHTAHEPQPLKLWLKQRGVVAADKPIDLEWIGLECRNSGKRIMFMDFICDRIDQMALRDRKVNSSKYCLEGTHWSRQAETIVFEAGEFFIGDIDVENMTLGVNFHVTVSHRKLIAKFELKGQGRLFSFEPIEGVILGKQIEIDLVQRI